MRPRYSLSFALDASAPEWYSVGMKAFYLYVAIITAVTFFVYGYDKLAARRKLVRIPEAVLIALAAIGGSIGAECAMLLFRHKTKHPLFALGVPIILILQIVALLLYSLLG